MRSVELFGLQQPTGRTVVRSPERTAEASTTITGRRACAVSAHAAPSDIAPLVERLRPHLDHDDRAARRVGVASPVPGAGVG